VCCRSNSSELIPRQQPTIILLRRVNTADDTRFCLLSPFSGLAFFRSLLSALVSILISLHPNYLSSSFSSSSRWGRGFPHPSRPALGPTQSPIQWVPGVKRPGRGVDHPPSSSVEVKERVELYLYSPSGLSWPVLGRTLPLH
jgi:hypothetical protein